MEIKRTIEKTIELSFEYFNIINDEGKSILAQRDNEKDVKLVNFQSNKERDEFLKIVQQSISHNVANSFDDNTYQTNINDTSITFNHTHDSQYEVSVKFRSWDHQLIATVTKTELATIDSDTFLL
jgi:hypothetical protein